MARILIADDDELIAELVSGILIDAGHACGWVTSGESAWETMKLRCPDLLLLDQDMPGISGVSLLRNIRSSEVFYDLPVVMFTAMRGQEDENRAIYAGAHDYIRKPFTPKRLLDTIESVLFACEGKQMDLKTRLARDSGMLDGNAALARRYI